MALEGPTGGNNSAHHNTSIEKVMQQVHSLNYIFLKSPSRIVPGYYRVSR